MRYFLHPQLKKDLAFKERLKFKIWCFLQGINLKKTYPARQLEYYKLYRLNRD